MHDRSNRLARLLPLLVGLLLVTSLACGATRRQTGDAPAPEAPLRTVTLVSFNDFHGGLYEQPLSDEPGRAIGGLPWLVAAVDALRAERPHLILIDGGDSFQGSWAVNATRGMASVEAFNLLGVDVTVVGNHDFDYGGAESRPNALRGALREAAEASDFVWLSANIVQSSEIEGVSRWQPPGFEPWTVIERNGVRVGLIGLTTTETPQTTLRQNVADLQFLDPVDTVRELLPELEAAGVDAVVVVGHLTGSCDDDDAQHGEVPRSCLPDGELGRLLTELPRGSIDVIVAGHEHALMTVRWQDTFVVESGDSGAILNRLDLAVGPDGVIADASTLWPPWLLIHDRVDPGCEGGTYSLHPQRVGDRVIEPDAEALALVRSIEERVGSLCDPVGCTAEPLARERQGESSLGNVVADAILAAFDDVDVAYQNSGGLRADLPAGEILREDIYAVMPFDNRLLVIEVSGEQLETMFRVATSGAHGIPQVAGMRYGFDPEREGGIDLDGDGAIATFEQNRLCFVEVGGEPVQPDARYRVALTDFLYGGGDHLGIVLADVPVVEEGPLLRDAIMEYVGRQTECLGADEPLVDPAEPRIAVGTCAASLP